jgi:hypothetical protein
MYGKFDSKVISNLSKIERRPSKKLTTKNDSKEALDV